MSGAIGRAVRAWAKGSYALAVVTEEGGNDDVAQTIAIEEYKALRSEIQDRVKNEFVLITASATLTSAGVALWAQSRSQSITFLLGIPLLSFLLGFLHFAQENSIAAAAAYLNKNVRPRLLALMPHETAGRSDVMAWEHFRHQKIYQAPWPIQAITAIGVSTPAVPGIAITVILTIRAFWRQFRDQLAAVHIVLLVTNWFLIMFVIIASLHNVRMYNAITSE